MPIYAYQCASCGLSKDVLQKISDDPLTQCPACGQDSFRKQLTAAGFQLKGSGWYVTDFRGGNNGATDSKGSSASSESKASAAEPSAAPAKADTAAAPAPAPAAATTGASGAGH